MKIPQANVIILQQRSHYDTMCITSPIVDISAPTNVNLTHLPHLREVFLTWEPGESYYGLPYPNISFFFKVTNVKDDSETTPWLEVIGRVQTLAVACVIVTS